MKQRMRDVIVLKTNKSGLIFGGVMLAIMPVFCSLLLVRPANAASPLGLVRDIVDPLQKVLSSPTQATPTATPSSSPTQAAAANSSAPSHSSATAQAVPYQHGGVSSPSESATSGALAFVEPIAIDELTALRDSAVNPASLAAVQTSPQLSQVSTTPWVMLRATGQGWQLAGVMWYWWLVIGAALGTGVTTAKHLYLRSGKNVAL